MQTVENQKLFPILDSLNQLSSIPWRINTPVRMGIYFTIILLYNRLLRNIFLNEMFSFSGQILDLMIKIFVGGGSEKLDIPKPASSFDINSLLNHDGKKVSKPTYSQQLYITRKKGEMHSLWCEALYRLSLANHVSIKYVYFLLLASEI